LREVLRVISSELSSNSRKRSRLSVFERGFIFIHSERCVSSIQDVNRQHHQHQFF